MDFVDVIPIAWVGYRYWKVLIYQVSKKQEPQIRLLDELGVQLDLIASILVAILFVLIFS